MDRRDDDSSVGENDGPMRPPLSINRRKDPPAFVPPTAYVQPDHGKPTAIGNNNAQVDLEYKDQVRSVAQERRHKQHPHHADASVPVAMGQLVEDDNNTADPEAVPLAEAEPYSAINMGGASSINPTLTSRHTRLTEGSDRSLILRKNLIWAGAFVCFAIVVAVTVIAALTLSGGGDGPSSPVAPPTTPGALPTITAAPALPDITAAPASTPVQETPTTQDTPSPTESPTASQETLPPTEMPTTPETAPAPTRTPAVPPFSEATAAPTILPGAFETKLTAPGADANANFAYDVAIDGTTVIVGARSGDSGSAWIFVRQATDWTLQAQLVASDGATSDSFGDSVALDADTAVVGARFGGGGVGASYVFVRSAGDNSWSQEQILTAGNAAGAGDEFGRSVAIDGDTIVVGARNDDNNGVDSGSLFVFMRSGDSWSLEAFLAPSAAGDSFGFATGIAGDTIVAGAYLDDDQGLDSGSAFIFTRSEGGTWTQDAMLLAPDGTAGNEFGISVSIDGDTVAIGAWRGETPRVIVYVKSGSTWIEQAQLTPSNSALEFGYDASVSGDIIAAGAFGDNDNGSQSGSAFIFKRNGDTWTELAKLIASDGATDDRFGFSVAAGNNFIVTGAYKDNNNQGSAYLYEVDQL